MQKKIIALAVAGLVSGAAFAESNVTIYGVMDATYDNISATGASNATESIGGLATPANLPGRGRTTFNGSYIGFKGVESLGNGYAVAFQVETGFGEAASTAAFGSGAVGGGTATTAGAWASRDTYVGLAGPFGTVAFGNLTGPTRALGAAMDVNAGATGIGANTALLGKLGGGSGAGVFDQRIANAIAYISPNMSGFTGVVGYMPNENRGAEVPAGSTPTANTSAWTLGLTYSNGPIYAGLAWTKAKDSNANNFGSGTTYAHPVLGALAINDATNTRLGFKYDFGMGTVGIMWDQTKATFNTVVFGGGGAKQTVWYLPVTFKVGSNGTVFGQYGKANNMTIDGLTGTAVAALAAPTGGFDVSAKHWEIGYAHELSKRTSVKVLYSAITNAKDGTYDYLYGTAASNTTAYGAGVAPGADPRGLSIGLRHSF